MSVIEKIRQWPYERKVRFIWICVAIVVILLVIAWVVSSQYQSDRSARINIFRGLSDGVNNAKSNLKNPLK